MSPNLQAMERSMVIKMIETNRLILDKAVFSDWKEMYENVWSHPESARYMRWRVTTNEEDARTRIKKTIEFQKEHDTYLVYEKEGRRAIGFAGVEETAPGVYSEAGICLGPRYVRKGYGREIVLGLMRYCRQELGAREFIYSSWEENEASNALAASLGFQRFSSEAGIDDRDGHAYTIVKYRLKLQEKGEDTDAR